MGRSAKVHKRTQKKTASSTSTAVSAPIPTPRTKPAAASAATPAEQKKRAVMKAKAKAGASRRKGDEGPVLGGADYVELMLGGRRKAMDEAVKLPKDEC